MATHKQRALPMASRTNQLRQHPMASPFLRGGSSSTWGDPKWRNCRGREGDRLSILGDVAIVLIILVVIQQSEDGSGSRNGDRIGCIAKLLLDIRGIF